jgi:hypothetical protein
VCGCGCVGVWVCVCVRGVGFGFGCFVAARRWLRKTHESLRGITKHFRWGRHESPCGDTKAGNNGNPEMFRNHAGPVFLPVGGAVVLVVGLL